MEAPPFLSKLFYRLMGSVEDEQSRHEDGEVESSESVHVSQQYFYDHSLHGRNIRDSLSKRPITRLQSRVNKKEDERKKKQQIVPKVQVNQQLTMEQQHLHRLLGRTSSLSPSEHIEYLTLKAKTSQFSQSGLEPWESSRFFVLRNIVEGEKSEFSSAVRRLATEGRENVYLHVHPIISRVLQDNISENKKRAMDVGPLFRHLSRLQFTKERKKSVDINVILREIRNVKYVRRLRSVKIDNIFSSSSTPCEHLLKKRSERRKSVVPELCRDEFLMEMCKEHDVKIVFSGNSFTELITMSPPNFMQDFIVPIRVENGVVYVEKPMSKHMLTPRELNTRFFQKALREYVLVEKSDSSNEEEALGYSLCSMNNSKFVVRYHVDSLVNGLESGCEVEKELCIACKLEHIPHIGLEEYTYDELCKVWSRSFVRQNADILFGHIDPMSSNVFHVDRQESSMFRKLGFNPEVGLFHLFDIIQFLEGILSECDEMSNIRFILLHRVGDCYTSILRKETESDDEEKKRDMIDMGNELNSLGDTQTPLRQKYVTVAASYTQPIWIPIPGQIPRTFPPVNPPVQEQHRRNTRNKKRRKVK